jgi:hypothetical protein
VSCNEVNSDFMVNNASVPQGSILSPLLILIFIDDIKEIQLRGTSEEIWDRLEEAINVDLGRM